MIALAATTNNVNEPELIRDTPTNRHNDYFSPGAAATSVNFIALD